MQQQFRETFTDIPTEDISAHQFLKSIYNVTIKRGWPGLCLQFVDNAKIFWESGKALYDEMNEDERYVSCSSSWKMPNSNHIPVILSDGSGSHSSRRSLMRSLRSSTIISFRRTIIVSSQLVSLSMSLWLITNYLVVKIACRKSTLQLLISCLKKLVTTPISTLFHVSMLCVWRRLSTPYMFLS